MCKPHWDELREAIRARGIYDMVSANGPELAERLQAGKFDPLMSAHMAIVTNAMQVVGLDIMANNEDGSERCPLCYLIGACPCNNDPCSFKTWINQAADDAAKTARELRGQPS